MDRNAVAKEIAQKVQQRFAGFVIVRHINSNMLYEKMGEVIADYIEDTKKVSPRFTDKSFVCNIQALGTYLVADDGRLWCVDTTGTLYPVKERSAGDIMEELRIEGADELTQGAVDPSDSIMHMAQVEYWTLKAICDNDQFSTPSVMQAMAALLRHEGLVTLGGYALNDRGKERLAELQAWFEKDGTNASEPSVEPPDDYEVCPVCRHVAHGNSVCLNMQSDNGCDCKGPQQPALYKWQARDDYSEDED